MSGIAALVTRDGRPAPASDVLAMLDAIPYRGPDGAFARHYGQAVLGHARMITTQSERNVVQPLTSRHTGCAIVADLRLDNREELRAHLGHSQTARVSDAWLVLQAYERWGLDAPRRLQGDFAFAIWDPREQRLVCARDSAGQRTLFYRSNEHTFAAASEIHQLLQDPSVSIEPDDDRIRSRLLPINLFQNDREQQATYYAGISSLLPGHVLVLTPAGLESHRFYQLTPIQSIRYRTQADYVEHFRDLFFQVVADRLTADGPIGALLSGGLDSSSMVCVAQELFRSATVEDRGFSTFSAVYDGLECDERPLIEDVQARYGFEAHYLQPDPSREWLPLTPGGFRQLPAVPTSGLMTMLDAAQDKGTRVLLTGEVADSCLRGSPLVLDSLLRQGKFRALAPYLNAHRRLTRDSLRKTLALYLAAPLLPRAAQVAVMRAYRQRVLELDRWRHIPTWMPDSLRDSLFEANRNAVLDAESARQFANETQHSLFASLDTPETPMIAWGWPIEIWRPYADRRLHEYLLAIPPEQLFEPGPNDRSSYGGAKQMLRQSMVGMLPDSIRTRRRPTHFGATVEQNMERHWPLYEAAFGPDSRAEISERGYIDPKRFWERMQHFRVGGFGLTLSPSTTWLDSRPGYVDYVVPAGRSREFRRVLAVCPRSSSMTSRLASPNGHWSPLDALNFAGKEVNNMGMKTYRSPQLVEYGRVEDVTRGRHGGWLDACIGQIADIGDDDGGINPWAPEQPCPWGGGSQ